MILYLGMTVVSMLFAKAAVDAKKKNDANGTVVLFSLLSLLPFILVASLRNEVGTDWHIYRTFFDSINTGGDKFIEPGFNLLNRLAYLISDNFAVLIAIVAVIIYSFVFRAIYDQSVIIPFSILMFVISSDFFNSLNQLRQVLAMAIFLYSLRHLWKREPVRYFLWIAVAVSMHMSALFYVPLYFLYGRKVNMRLHILIFLGNIALWPLLSKLFKFMVTQTKYEWYFGSAYDTNDFYIAGFVFSLVVLGLYYYYYHYGKDKQDHQYNLMVNMYFISSLLLLYSSALPQVVRLSNSFAVINCLCIPRMVLRETDRNRRIILYITVVLLFTAKVLYDIYINDWYLTAPQLPSLI